MIKEPLVNKIEHTTLWRELYDWLVDGMRDGLWKPGAPLPSSRELARARGVSRSTVVTVFDQLAAEGLVEPRGGSGTYVAWIEPGRRRPAAAPATPPVPDTGFGPLDTDRIDFRSGLPDLDAFPLARWNKAQAIAMRRYGTRLLSYGPSEGMEELRRAIAGSVARSRGWMPRPENLVITSGTTQAIGLVSRLMAHQGKTTAWLEDPVTADIPRIMTQAGLEIGSCPLERDGLSLSPLPARLDQGFVYVTPTHQYPSGRVLSLAKRLALLDRCAGASLVEDDYDSEFRYDGPPLTPLVALDPERVLHVGTFSKTLAPGLRIAWLHLPDALIATARRLKWLSDLHNPPLIQGALTVFIEEGWYELHLRRMRSLYRRKRDLALRAIEASGKFKAEGSAAGIHLMVRRLAGVVDRKFQQACLDAGVRIYPVAAHVRKATGLEDAFILGFGHLTPEQIAQGCARLNEAES